MGARTVKCHHNALAGIEVKFVRMAGQGQRLDVRTLAGKPKVNADEAGPDSASFF